MKRITSIFLTLALLISFVLPMTAFAAGNGWYEVCSTSPNGYCYLYSNASDRDGLSVNRGRYNNGTIVYVLDYYGGQDGKYNYCYVQTQDGKTGYMHDYALRAYNNNYTWYVVNSSQPKGYCYLYTAASDRDGISTNMGRYNNGSLVRLLEYYGGQDGKYNYCLVQTMDGKTGYMHDYAIRPFKPGEVIVTPKPTAKPTARPTAKPTATPRPTARPVGLLAQLPELTPQGYGNVRGGNTYAPYGQVTAEGDITQPIQWSSEYNDAELGLVYYNYRHYNPVDGKWICYERGVDRDSYNLYAYALSPVNCYDYIGDTLRKKKQLNSKKVSRLKAGGVTTGKFNVRVIPSNTPFFSKLSYEGDLEITAEYIEDKDGYNKKHEDYHIKISLKHWNLLVDEIGFLERIYCSTNIGYAMEYAKSAIYLRDSLAKMENARFDANEYIYIGRTQPEYFERVLNEYKKEYNDINQKIKTYHENRMKYYEKVENKKKRRKKIIIPEPIFITGYTSPIK